MTSLVIAALLAVFAGLVGMLSNIFADAPEFGRLKEKVGRRPASALSCLVILLALSGASYHYYGRETISPQAVMAELRDIKDGLFDLMAELTVLRADVAREARSSGNEVNRQFNDLHIRLDRVKGAVLELRAKANPADLNVEFLESEIARLGMILGRLDANRLIDTGVTQASINCAEERAMLPEHLGVLRPVDVGKDALSYRQPVQVRTQEGPAECIPNTRMRFEPPPVSPTSGPGDANAAPEGSADAPPDDQGGMSHVAENAGGDTGAPTRSTPPRPPTGLRIAQ
jgi:hypothetical protein